jgi:hypothetical protein
MNRDATVAIVGSAAGRHGGGVAGSLLEWCSYGWGWGFTMSSRGGGGDNDEVGSALIRDEEAFWWQCDGSEGLAVESFSVGALGSGERAK